MWHLLLLTIILTTSLSKIFRNTTFLWPVMSRVQNLWFCLYPGKSPILAYFTYRVAYYTYILSLHKIRRIYRVFSIFPSTLNTMGTKEIKKFIILFIVADFKLSSEAYSKPCQMIKKELFVKNISYISNRIVNKPLQP